MIPSPFERVLDTLTIAAGFGGVLGAVVGVCLLGNWLWTSYRIRARLRELPSEEEIRRRLAKLEQQTPLSDSERLGLVLSGGGGKGAYEIGCLEALRDAGLNQFSAIAGTSVGALNAALVAQGDLAEAREIWRTISRSRVLRFVAPFRRVLRRLPLLPFYFFRHLGAERKRIPPSLWETASVYWRTRQLTDADWRRLVKDSKLVIDKVIGSFLGLLAASLCLALLSLLTSLVESDSRAQQDIADLVLDGWKVFLIAPGLIISVTLLWFWFVSRDKHLGQSLSIASNEPLRQLLTKHLVPEKLRAGPSTFVTVASLRIVESSLRSAPVPSVPPFHGETEPEELTATAQPHGRFRRWWKKHLSAENDFSTSSTVAEDPREEAIRLQDSLWSSGRVAYVPTYILLQDMSSEDIRERILDSGSLPEIFPRRIFDGEDQVDGGVADNTPLLPLLQAGIQKVVVIYLDRDQGLADSAARVRQLELERVEARSFGSNRTSTPTPLPTTTASLIRIVPSVSLGSLVSGTLNFSAKRVRQLMRLGYTDTLKGRRRNNFGRHDTGSEHKNTAETPD